MVFETWLSKTFEALEDLWFGMLDYLPNIIGALIVFIVGWIVAVIIGRIVSEVLIRLRFNELFEKSDWRHAFDKAKLTVKPAEFLGAIVKWILVIVFLMAAVDVLGLKQFSIFLGEVVSYLPNVFIAALIFVVAVILADIVEKVVVASVEKMKIGYSHVAGVIVKWAIWIMAIFAIFSQLKIAEMMTETLFMGIVAFLVIAGGLAFGLGGKDVAAEILQDIKRRVRG